ncbi:hypothetical protein N0B31_00805 [Salinirubellus salinus]|uniref:Uncharacterized protein n=1 Tax=Salinirubellus salinus TaxID=1364945 RepID=A0A9E7R3E5_9EURY|nr:hypothetical protein [Salinirubellus salinus]UWM54832.1 hypothetical protein N0B31_00805 [Salinirubellus salinus]
MTRELRRWHRWSTVAILAFSVGSSLVGLLRPGHYRAPPDIALSYQIQDLTVLLVGVPVLAVGLWSAARGSPRGRLVWLGGMAFMTYIWASAAIQIPYNELFLVYVALFGLSLFTFVGGMWSTDPERIRRRLEGRVDPALYAGALFVVGLGLAALWLSDILPALLQGTTPTIVEESGPQALTSHVVDLGVVVPSILLAAVWLYRRRTWGYVLAGVVLILGATLAAPIGLMTLVLLTGETVTVSPVAAFFTFLPIVVSALLAVAYVRSMSGSGGIPGDGEGAQST